MLGTSSRAYLLLPHWLLVDDGDALDAVHLIEGTRLDARGALRANLLSGDLDRRDRALASLDASVGELVKARGAARPVPLDRAALLEGSGWKRLFVELTGRCNERCTHCYASAGPEVGEALDPETIEHVLEDAAALGFASVQLTGGDPLVSPHCLSAARRGRELGIDAIEVFTNGLALSPSLYAGLKEVGVSFAFSIYSHDPARHDDVTQTPGSLVSTARAIRRAVEGGSPVRVGIILMAGDEDHERRTIEFVEELGVPASSIRSALTLRVGRGTLAEGSLLAKKSRPPGPYPNLGGTIAVAYDGDVHPCIFSRGTLLGSVRDDRLRTILEAPEPIAPPDVESLMRSITTPHPSLACWECRVGENLLEGARR